MTSSAEPRATILVVDDDEPTQKLLQALLRRCGFSTDIAADGRDAIEMLRERHYAAVVLDVMMPTVGGHAVVDFLAGQERLVPVIICSAAGPAMLTGFSPKVVKAVVRKPFDVEQFATVVAGITRA